MLPLCELPGEYKGQELDFCSIMLFRALVAMFWKTDKMTRTSHLQKPVSIVLNAYLFECSSLEAKGEIWGIARQAALISCPAQGRSLRGCFSGPDLCVASPTLPHRPLPLTTAREKPPSQPGLLLPSMGIMGSPEIDVSSCSLQPSPLAWGARSSYPSVVLAAQLVLSFTPWGRKCDFNARGKHRFKVKYLKQHGHQKRQRGVRRTSPSNTQANWVFPSADTNPGYVAIAWSRNSI